MSARVWGAATAVVLLLALGACGSDDDEPSGSPTSGGQASEPGSGAGSVAPGKEELSGRTYEATSVEGHTLIPGTTLRVGFDGDNLAVRAGCNTLHAPYTFEGLVLKWTSTPAATMMGCPQELLDQDEWLTGLFTTGMEASVDQFGANLTNGEVTIQLIRDDGGV